MRRENKELHNLYASPNSYGDQMKKDEWAGDVARMGEIRNCLQNYGRETWREETCRKKLRCEDNIRKNLKEIW